MEKGVLGIWDGHDASVSLIADGRLVFALSEERPTRRQRFSGFPYRALGLCLDWAAENRVEIEDVAVAGRLGRAPLRALDRLYSRHDPHRDPLAPTGWIVRTWENRVAGMRGFRALERAFGLSFVRRRVRKALGRDFRLHQVDHHDAHAFSAMFGPDRENALVLTFDAYGEGCAATARLPDDPATILYRAGPGVGLASLYGAVTVCMGFEEGDEGKVMGLAAHGRRDMAVRRFMDMFQDRDGTPVLRRALTRGRVEEVLTGLTVEDAAASLQACVERLASRWVAGRIREAPGTQRLMLAGGLFANVRLNQILASLPGVNGLFVFPNMGDGGLSAGAAHNVWHRITGEPAKPLDHVFLGCRFDRTGMVEAARERGLGCVRVGSPDEAAADHLKKGRVVCRFAGREEFGPRALGNRSILFSAGVQGLGERVNRALGRDDYMPFGPAIRDVAAGFALGGVPSGVDFAHMTVTADTTGEFREECPSAVHVDKTTRPQIVNADEAPEFSELLSRHRSLGGRRAIINTSFNMHGEPIVHSPADAVDTFIRSKLDVLYMEDIEVRRRGI